MKTHNLYTIIPYKKKLLKFTGASSARAYYKNYSVDLLNDTIYEKEGIEHFCSKLHFPAADKTQDLRVMHLFYELGFLFENLEDFILHSEILAIDIQYTESSEVFLGKKKAINLSLLQSPDYHQYKKQFDQGYQHLRNGDCYQFNLTGVYQYRFSSEQKVDDFIEALWSKPQSRGAYASATYCESLGQLFLSNSPECLFQLSEGQLISRPIKGTFLRESAKPSEVQKLWKKLSDDKKSQAELYMITDLLRNDLCRIDLPNARVNKKKAKLLVPGLIHQYSEIEIHLNPKITLIKVLEKIFPGGSITGAPKRGVMKILSKIESRPRGFYCGSTLIFRNGLIEASINIRSSVIDLKQQTLTYQAGGGITLLSDAKDEFEEMTYKHNSYIHTLTR